MGLLWFAARREWRSLALPSARPLRSSRRSWLINPGLWTAWLDLLLREASGTASAGHVPIPLVLRLPLAAALAVFAGRRDIKWLMPVVVLLAMPVLWWGSLSVLIGCVAIERDRIERLAVTTLATLPSGCARGSPAARARPPPPAKA